MKVAQIWRYPVKSMAGEQIDHARIGPLGIEGDRVVHVEDEDGRVITARTHHRLLGHHGTLNDSGEPVVDGLPWSNPKVHTAVEDIVGPGAKLVRDDSSDRFDVLPLLVATDGAITAFGRDGRRLRPNLVIGGVPGLEERNWEGQRLRVGDVIIELVDLRGRCRLPQPKRGHALGAVTWHDVVEGLGIDLRCMAPHRRRAGRLGAFDPSAKAHRVVDGNAREFPRSAVSQPGVGPLHLTTGLDRLREHAELVADAVAVTGQPQGGHAVEEAGRQPAESTIAEAGIGFGRLDVLQRPGMGHGAVGGLAMQTERLQAIAQAASDQELHRQVIDTPHPVASVGRLACNPAPGQFGPHGLRKSGHQLGRLRVGGGHADGVQQVVLDGRGQGGRQRVEGGWGHGLGRIK